MLPFEFDYYKPATLREAIDLYQSMDRQGKQPIYFSGGTELLTLGRINLAYSNAVIDIKDIQECRVMGASGDYLVLGSALSLTKIEEANVFPLLTKTTREVADHTARGKITLGGNICAQIFYREAILPLLLSDSQFIISGPNGSRMESIHDIFIEQIQLGRGELLVQIATEQKYLTVPFVSQKRRQQWDTGYPLVTVAALYFEEATRFAVSGYCPFPFRSKEAEALLNNRSLTIEERIKGALDLLPDPVLNDVEGSAEFRKFTLGNMLRDVLIAFEGGSNLA